MTSEIFKSVFWSIIIFAILFASMHFYGTYPLAKFTLFLTDLFIVVVMTITGLFTIGMKTEDAREKYIANKDLMEKEAPKLVDRLRYKGWIYTFNTAVVCAYTIGWLYAASLGLYVTAFILLASSIIAFIFPRVLIPFAEYVKAELDRRAEKGVR